MIEKIIHYVWVGGEKPEEVIRNIDGWKKVLSSDWKIIEWNEKNWDINQSEFTKYWYSKKKYAFVSDYIRLDVIQKYGGFYLDTDIQLNRTLDSLVTYDYVASRTYVVGNTASSFGAKKGNELIKQQKSLFDVIGKKYGHLIGGDFQTYVLRKKISIPDTKETYIENNIAILSENILQIDTGNSDNISVHYHYANWDSKKKVYQQSEYYLKKVEAFNSSNLSYISKFQKERERKFYKMKKIDNNSQKIDVIIPVYNVKKYMKRSVNCWNNQSLDKSLFRVTFIDDGSSDGTYDELVALTKGNELFQVIKQLNTGAAGARQKGLENTHGEWVIYVDGDGYVSKNYLKSFHNAISWDYDLIFSDNYKYIYEGKRALTFFRRIGQYFINMFYNLRNRTDVGDTTNKLWRRSAVQNVKWEQWKRGEDWLYFSRCMKEIRKDAYRRVIFNNIYIDNFARQGSTADLVKRDNSFLIDQYKSHFMAYEELLKSNHKMSKSLAESARIIAEWSKNEYEKRA